MKLTAASYLAECQVITLRPEFAALADPQNIRGFRSPREIAYFFHEWIHYLHNISTLHGVSAFLNQVALWSVFRFTLRQDGTSVGSKRLPPSHWVPMRQNLEFLSKTRAPRPVSAMLGPDDRPFSITSVTEEKLRVADTAAEITVLRCNGEVPQLEGDANKVTVEIGAHEVLESIAFLLESELLTQLERRQSSAKESTQALARAPANIVPYRLLEALGRFLAPQLGTREVLLCGIASLQSSDPVGQLANTFAVTNQMASQGKDVVGELRKEAAHHLALHASWLQSELSGIDKALPLDEPFARSVKHTVSLIRSNFDKRRQDPFFELQIIDDVVKAFGDMDAVMKAHGGCCIIQQRPGDDDQVGRDLMYDVMLGPPDASLEHGLRMMHAGFRYIALHATADSALPTGEIPLGKSKRCPFYSICDDPLRQSSPDVCASQPWASFVLKKDGESCWYSEAVRVLRPTDLSAEFLFQRDGASPRVSLPGTSN